MAQFPEFFSVLQKLSLPDFTFKDAAKEHDYLQRRFQNDKLLVQSLVFIVALTLALLLFSDHLIIQHQYWPEVAILWRGGYVVLSMAFIVYLKNVSCPYALRRLAVLFTIVLMANLLLMDLTFEKDYILFIYFDVIIIIAIYFSTILSFSTSLILCVSYGILASLSIWQFKEVTSHSLIMSTMAYFAANMTGIILSINQHISRRLFFKNNLKLVALTDQLYVQANFDPLTNVKNRRSFDKDYQGYLKSVIRANQDNKDVYVIAADIDHFKEINDNYGHVIGDQILIKFCERINSLIRPSDDIYRFGGEEFIVIIQNVSQREVIDKVQSFIVSLNNKGFSIDDTLYPVLSSFGITNITGQETKELVLARADRALYKAKQLGRNRLEIIYEDGK